MDACLDTRSAPTSGRKTKALTLSRTSFSKFFSAATLRHTQPSFNHSVFTLYVWLGTAEMITSEISRHSWRDWLLGCTIWRGWYRCEATDSAEIELDVARGRFVYSCPEKQTLAYLSLADAMNSLTCIDSMSTENTRAPSLARSAARGLPTTSDLKRNL